MWVFNLTLLFSVLLAGFMASAQSVKVQIPLSDLARTEIQQTGQIKAAPSNAQVASGVLSLKDPRPEIRGRSWNYFLALDLQSFQPKGHASNDLSNANFNLDDNHATVMPSFGLGFRSPLLTRETWQVSWGLMARLGYSSQRTSAKYANGFVERDAQLTSTMLSAGPQLGWSLERLRWLTLDTGFEWGNLNYTQASSNPLATFNRHSPYTGWNTGLEFELKENWTLMTSYWQRQLTGKASRLALQADNFELGTRILW